MENKLTYGDQIPVHVLCIASKYTSMFLQGLAMLVKINIKSINTFKISSARLPRFSVAKIKGKIIIIYKR